MRASAYWKIATYLLLALWLAFTILPLYWLLSATFKSPSEAIGYPPTLFPRHWTLENFADLVLHSRFGFEPFLNSAIIAVGATLISTLTSMLAGFGFSRFSFPFKQQGLVLLLLLQMIPILAVIVPLYRMYAAYGLYDTRIGLMLVYAMWTIPLNTWLLKGYFDTIPKELEEAALIDGCSRMNAFLRVSFPIAAPGVAAAAIFGFSRSWNEFILALTLTSQVRPYTVELYRFIGEYGEVSWNLIATASFIALVPVLIMFALFQKYFIAGLSGGSLKG